MGKTVMGAVVSLDGFMADDNDGVGPLFDWLGNGDVSWSFEGSDGESQSTQASADFMRAQYAGMAANVIGRRVFDLTNGWDGKPAAGDQIVVNLVPVVFGSGRPFFATGPLADPILLENPSQIIPGDRVTHLVYDVPKR